MDKVIEVIQPAFISFLGTVVTCLFGYLGYKAKQTYTKYVDNQVKKDVVNSTVNYVEQVYKDIHGEEKLQKAKEKVVEILTEQGISITDSDLEMLIESAVYGLNASWLEISGGTVETKEALENNDSEEQKGRTKDC